MSVSKKWMYLNHIYGWGVPSMVLLITLVNILMDEARTEEEIINLRSYEFSKFIPITILWLINCVLLGMVLYYAIKCPSERMNRRVIQYRFVRIVNYYFLWILKVTKKLLWHLDLGNIFNYFWYLDFCGSLNFFHGYSRIIKLLKKYF